jgi:hypothetical protein
MQARSERTGPEGLSPGRRRAALVERLRERRPEIEAAILARVSSLEAPAKTGDPTYAEGLRAAVSYAVGYAISVFDGEEAHRDRVPPELIAQARLAARSGVSIDTVLRRYVAGHNLLCDFLLEEAGEDPAAGLRRALRAEGVLLDRIAGEVTDAYRHEIAERSGSTDRRRVEQVKMLLAGEPGDALQLGYDLEGWHLGLVASGTGSTDALRQLAAALDRRLLIVRPGGCEAWAWLGGHRRIAPEAVVEQAIVDARFEFTLAVGEPGRGVSGWRLSHRQAKAALPVALRERTRAVVYSEVALLASVLGDEVLTSSLTERYLTPLEAERDGGAVLRETLRAYFATGRNGASSAAALGISRQTVNVRLHTVEERIGRSLEACAAEVETALRLWDLDRPGPTA